MFKDKKWKNEWRVKVWLIPVPFMALIGVVVTIFLFKDVSKLSFFHFLFGFGLSALLMFPFMWKYEEMYRKLDW